MLYTQDIATQLWNQYKQRFAISKMQMLQSGKLNINGRTMIFQYKMKGKRPNNGYTLIFGFHGGGGTTAQANNQQYNNHKNLYNNFLPDGSIWFTPRSCQNQWDMWLKDYMQDFILQITHAFALNNIIDINKVFLTGYSAGGDGIYHMAPRMADYLAGAAMMAGHPNGINLMNIRNIGFSLQVGGDDSAYNRNRQGIKYIRMLNQMGQNYGSFKHQSRIHQGKPHWMGLQDAKIFGWLFAFTRNPYPDTIVYKQCPRRKKYLFYYIRFTQPKTGQSSQQIIIKKQGNNFKILSNRIVTILINKNMININEPIIVTHNHKITLNRRFIPKSEIAQKTFFQRLDPYYIFQDEFVSEPGQIIDMKIACCTQFQLQPIQKQAQYEKPLPMNPSELLPGFNDSIKPLPKKRKTSAPNNLQQEELLEFRKQQTQAKWQKWQDQPIKNDKKIQPFSGKGQMVGGGQKPNPWTNQNHFQKQNEQLNTQNSSHNFKKSNFTQSKNESNSNIQQKQIKIMKRDEKQCCSLQ